MEEMATEAVQPRPRPQPRCQFVALGAAPPVKAAVQDSVEEGPQFKKNTMLSLRTLSMSLTPRLTIAMTATVTPLQKGARPPRYRLENFVGHERMVDQGRLWIVPVLLHRDRRNCSRA